MLLKDLLFSLVLWTNVTIKYNSEKYNQTIKNNVQSIVYCHDGRYKHLMDKKVSLIEIKKERLYIEV